MPTKFATRITKQLRQRAADNAPYTCHSKFGDLSFGAKKFERRTQAYLSGLPVSFVDLELNLARVYRELYGDKPSEDVVVDITFNEAIHVPVTRGQRDYAKANPEPTPPPKPVLTTIQEFKSAPPGSYTVAGEASGYLSRMQLMHYLDKSDQIKRTNAQTRHRRRLVRKAQNYSHAIMSEMFAITRRYGCEVRISGRHVTIIGKPKRLAVVKRLDKLARLYTRTYGVRGLMATIINHEGNRA